MYFVIRGTGPEVHMPNMTFYATYSGILPSPQKKTSSSDDTGLQHPYKKRYRLIPGKPCGIMDRHEAHVVCIPAKNLFFSPSPN